MAVLWAVPLFAAVLTIVTYLSALALPSWVPGHDQPPAVLGPVIAVLVWLILGLIYSGFASAVNANKSSFGELKARVDELVVRLDKCPELKTDPCLFDEAAVHRDYLVTALRSGGTPWVTAIGYITAWQRLHRAEEILILVEDRTQLLGDAVYDELRLTGSQMEHADLMLNMLVPAEAYLRQHVLGANVLSLPAAASAGAVTTTTAVPMATRVAAPASVQVSTETEARAAIRQVRRSINEYRDDTWAGIVRARNHLIRALFAAELAAYLLLELAVLMRAPPPAVLAAVGFFLIGALIGVFNRLNVQAKTDTAVDDYGLSTARLIVTPIFSGIAAVIGVALVGMLYSASLASAIQPHGGTAATGITIPSLADIYNLQTYPIGLIVAAIFGLTPTLVFDRLNKLTEGYKSDIKSTEATNVAPRTA